MTDILVALLLVLVLATAGLVTYSARKLRQATRRLGLLEYHLTRLIQAAYRANDAHHNVRHDGTHDDRLDQVQAMAELASVAEAARKREPVA